MNERSYISNHIRLRVTESKYTLFLVILLLCLFVGRLIPNPTTFRWVAVGIITFLLLAITAINVRKGIIATLIFLPFMAFIRRALYSVSPYVRYDLILLIAPAIALFVFLGIIMFREKQLSQTIQGDRFVKWIKVLLVLFILQIFNPLQENLLVGLGGALFYIIPMLWFFFGLHFADERLVHKVLLTIVIIGIITSVYGLCQMVFGFLPFERHWIETGGFASLHVGRFIRAFSTFSSPEEYSRYIQIGAVISFGYFLARKSLAWFLIFVLVGFTTVMTGVRSSVFGLLLSVLALLGIWRAKNLWRAFIRLVLLVSAFVVITSFVSSPFSESIYQTQSIFYTMGGHTARGFINPMNEWTFQSRLNLWKYLFMDVVPRNPLGYGLGSTSIAARKFGGGGVGTESYVFALFVNSGVVGGLLFLIICIAVLRKGIDLSVQSKGSKILPRLILAIIAGLTLNNIFGSSFVLYSVAPIGWFLIGWIAKQHRIPRIR